MLDNIHCWFTVSYLRCRFDYLATHWYSKTQNATETISALREYSERYGGLRIWFTEFAVRQVGPGPGAGPGAGAGDAAAGARGGGSGAVY